MKKNNNNNNDSASTFGESEHSSFRWESEETPHFPLPLCSNKISPRLPERQSTNESVKQDIMLDMLISADEEAMHCWMSGDGDGDGDEFGCAVGGGGIMAGASSHHPSMAVANAGSAHHSTATATTDSEETLSPIHQLTLFSRATPRRARRQQIIMGNNMVAGDRSDLVTMRLQSLRRVRTTNSIISSTQRSSGGGGGGTPLVTTTTAGAAGRRAPERQTGACAFQRKNTL